MPSTLNDLVTAVYKLVGWPSDASLEPLWRSGVSALLALAAIWIFDWLWSAQRTRKSKAQWSEIDDVLAELTDLRQTHHNPVRFIAQTNHHLLVLFVVGTAYLAGPNLFRFQDLLQFAQPPTWMVQIIATTVAILYFLFAFYFMWRGRRFLRLCSRHMNFEEHEQALLSKYEAMRRNVVTKPDEVIVGPAPQAELEEAARTEEEAPSRAAPAAAGPGAPAGKAKVEAARAREGKPNGAEEKPRVGRELPKWRTGRVQQWPEKGYFGFIDGDSAFGSGEGGVSHWTNVSRLATDSAPAPGTSVLFLEHPLQLREHNKVAVLVCPEGSACEGTIKAFPAYKGYCFAEIADDQGNTAEILVIAPKGQSNAWIEIGRPIRFTLSRNDMGPIGLDPEPLEPAAEGAAGDAARPVQAAKGRAPVEAGARPPMRRPTLRKPHEAKRPPSPAAP